MTQWARCFGDRIPWHLLRHTGGDRRPALCGATPLDCDQTVWFTTLEYQPAWQEAVVCPHCAYLATLDPLALLRLLDQCRTLFRELLDNYVVEPSWAIQAEDLRDLLTKTLTTNAPPVFTTLLQDAEAPR